MTASCVEINNLLYLLIAIAITQGTNDQLLKCKPSVKLKIHTYNALLDRPIANRRNEIMLYDYQSVYNYVHLTLK